MNICVFGDSIAWGSSDNVGGGWVARLRNNLAAQDDEVAVYNCGVSGNNTEDVLKRFDVEAAAREPEVIVFAIGINDSQYTGERSNARVPLVTFRKNLEELIAKAKVLTDKVLFVGLTRVVESKVMPVPWCEEEKNYDNANVELYDSAIRDVCKEHKLPYLDISTLITNDELEDGLHPNVRGHEKLYGAVRDFMSKQNIWTTQ
jgi:lysophospholipase L1-like esterase